MSAAPAGDSNLVEICDGVFVDPRKRAAIPLGQKWHLLDPAGYRKLGLKRSQWNTLRRLWETGWIQISMPAPRVCMLDMESWDRHLKRCQDDPWFWDRGAGNIERYRKSYGK